VVELIVVIVVFTIARFSAASFIKGIYFNTKYHSQV